METLPSSDLQPDQPPFLLSSLAKTAMFLLHSASIKTIPKARSTEGLRIVVPPLGHDALRWIQMVSFGYWVKKATAPEVNISLRVPTSRPELADWLDEHTAAEAVNATSAEVLRDGGKAVALVGTLEEIQQGFRDIAQHLRVGDRLLLLWEMPLDYELPHAPDYIPDTESALQYLIAAGDPGAPLALKLFRSGYAFLGGGREGGSIRHLYAPEDWKIQIDGGVLRTMRCFQMVQPPSTYAKQLKFVTKLAGAACAMYVLDSFSGGYLDDVAVTCIRNRQLLEQRPELVRDLAGAFLVHRDYIDRELPGWLMRGVERPQAFEIALADLSRATSLRGLFR